MNVLHELQSKLQDKVLTEDAVKERYEHIWSMDTPLSAKAVVLPTTTEEVAAVMKICHQYNQSIVVHGGLTNLVGSTETHVDEVVISLERMNTIEEIDTSSRTMTVGAGVVLERIQEAAKENDMFFPLNFGAKGSAQIGGVVSTNAGGLRVFRYGMTRALVLGLEAVLADGTVVSSMKKIIKDNSAYDIKQLFIGSEGTLGIVTKVVLKLVEPPQSRVSAFVAMDAFEDVVRFLKYMDRGMAGKLSGYELIWGNTYEKMTSPPALANPPVPQGYTYYVLVEGLGNDQEQDQQLLESLMEQAMEQELFVDGVIAHSQSDLEWFWKIREDVHVVKSQCVIDHHFDISIPIPLIGRMIDEMRTELVKIDGVAAAYPFGHIADGNIHFIVDKANHDSELKRQIDHVVYSPLKAVGGSVSAEHGIGTHKKAALHLCRTDEEISLMKLLKRTMDPKNILNRGKVLDL